MSSPAPPSSSNPARSPGASAPGRPGAASQAAAILVVEADNDDALRMAPLLTDIGPPWEVTVATSVAKAQALLSVGDFDMVLCAQWVQGGSAFDIHRLAGGTPVLIAVQPGQEAAAAEALRCGFADFVVLDGADGSRTALADRLLSTFHGARDLRGHAHAASAQTDMLAYARLVAEVQAACLRGAPRGSVLNHLLDGLLETSNADCAFALQVTQAPASRDSASALLALAALGPAGQPEPVTIAQENMAAVAAHLADLAHAVLHNPTALTLGPPPASAAADLLAWGYPPFNSLTVWSARVTDDTFALIGLGNCPTALDVSHVQPAANALADTVAAWHQADVQQSRQDGFEHALRQSQVRISALAKALDTASQGITLIDPEGRVRVHNASYCTMLDIPKPFMDTEPRLEDIVRRQIAQGDFGENLSLVDAPAREALVQSYPEISSDVGAPAETYLRRTPQGKILEVKTQQLDDGSRVRTFTDVTAYVKSQEALRQSDARWRCLTEISSDWYWEQDENFRFVRIDGKRDKVSGITDSASLGRTRWELPANGVTEQEWQEHRAILDARGTFHDFEMQRVGPDGQHFWVSISGAPLFDATGAFCGYSGVGRDITARKQAEAEIERLAFYDNLTQLPNRRLLLDRLGRAIVSSARKRRHGALLFLDLDNFKDLNDTLGHEWGDKLLQQVAKRILSCVRAGDTVARLGGDEFVVVLEELHEVGPEAAAEAEAVGQKILAALNKPYTVDHSELHSTPSIGITVFNDREQTVDELLKRADLAMYQAKAGGRNTLCFFDPDMQSAVTARSALESDLRHGLARDEFTVYYQPIVEAAGRLLGMEALVRWNHPQRGMVSPAHFIPLAEQTGLILDLGRKVLEVACTQLVHWSRSPRTAHLTVAVNVSARQFRHPDFVQHVLSVVGSSGVNPQRLKLELTESLLLNDVEDIIAKMNALRTLGIGFSLDDFGTGYSSLSYLKRLPLDQLKIDQSFVRDVLTDPNDAAIACTIVALAHSLGLAVVAEGVETAGQLDFLIRNGCQCFQGYLFGRPAPVDTIRDIVEAGGITLPRPG